MISLTNEQSVELLRKAAAMRAFAYAPYSNYAVGAALLTAQGAIYTGVNIENAAYPTGICAERVAIFSAVAAGEREFTAIAISTSNGGTPCGACRQVMAEFSQSMMILIGDAQGNLLEKATVKEMLPGAFGPDKLVE
jgi:cytidine deaminase